MSGQFLDGQIEIKVTIALFIPKHKHKRSYAKEICYLIKTIIEKKPLIKTFCFLETDKSITTCIQKEIRSMI